MKKVTVARTQQEKNLLSLRIKDATGVIPISLWGSHAEKHKDIKVGDCVKVDKAERGSYTNKATINTWEDSTTIEVNFLQYMKVYNIHHMFA